MRNNLDDTRLLRTLEDIKEDENSCNTNSEENRHILDILGDMEIFFGQEKNLDNLELVNPEIGQTLIDIKRDLIRLKSLINVPDFKVTSNNHLTHVLGNMDANLRWFDRFFEGKIDAEKLDQVKELFVEFKGYLDRCVKSGNKFLEKELQEEGDTLINL